MNEKIRATILAGMLVLSLVAMAAPISATASSASASTSGPDGMVGVPSENVGPPEHANGGAGPPMHAADHIPTDAGVWNVQSSKHAGDLQVEVGTTDDGELAMRLTDVDNHEGREVAIAKETLVDAVGHAPRVAYGTHSSGEEWTSPIRYEASSAVFRVPMFSTNTVTFDGVVSIQANSAENGTSLYYDLSDSGGVDEINTTLTGRINEVSQSVGGMTTGGTETVDVGGSLSPSNPTLEMTGEDGNLTHYTGTADYGWLLRSNSNGDYGSQLEFTGENVPEQIAGIWINVDGGDSYSSGSGDIYVDEGPISENPTAGTFVGSFSVNSDGGWEYLAFDSPYDVSSNPDNVSIGFDNTGGDSITIHADGSDSGLFWANGKSYAAGTGSAKLATGASNVSVTANGDTVSFGSLDRGESATENISLEVGSNDLNMSLDGEASWSLSYGERAETLDPAIELNGNRDSYSGSLAEGESVSLSLDPSWLNDGENRIDTFTSENNGVPTKVELDYNHSATVDQSVEYSAETWSEAYNISRTWDSATDDASVTIPFESSRVVSMRDLEYRVNGGSWNPIEGYELDGTTLVAQLGDVSEGDEVDVRAIGSKVRVKNGEINVLEPTVEGDSLDTKIELTDYSSNMSIGVGGSSSGQWVHYTAKESWSNPDSYVVLDDSGGQELHLPEGAMGSTTRVRTIPLEATPDAGSVEIQIEDPDEPRFNVRGGTADQVDVGWYDTVSGQKYALYSVSRDIDIDTDTAESPVWFVMETGSDTYTIEERDGGSGSEAVVGPTGSAAGSLQWTMLFGGIGLSIAGLWFVSRRFGGARGVRGNSLLIVGGAVIGTVGVELVTPQSFFATVLFELRQTAAGTAGTVVIGLAILLGLWVIDQRTSRDIPLPLLAAGGIAVMLWIIESIAPGTLSSGLEEIGPLVWLSIIGGGLWFARRWLRARNQPDTQVTLQLGDRGGGSN